MPFWKKCNGCSKKYDGAIHRDCPSCCPDTTPDLKDLSNTLLSIKDRLVFIDENKNVMVLNSITNCVNDGVLLVNIKKVEKQKKLFPMQDGPDIPWSLAEEIYDVYSKLYGKEQSLERLAERGGFGWAEVSIIWERKRKKGL